jgi:Tol biopolymer transport system component
MLKKRNSIFVVMASILFTVLFAAIWPNIPSQKKVADLPIGPKSFTDNNHNAGLKRTGETHDNAAFATGIILTRLNHHAALISPDAKNIETILNLQDSLVASNGVYPANLRLSPDGKRIAFLCYNLDSGSAKPQLTIRELGDMKKSSQDVRIDLREEESYYWCWSPDGNSLLISHAPLLYDNGDEKEIKCDLIINSHVTDIRRPKMNLVPSLRGHLVTDWSPNENILLTTSFPDSYKYDSTLDRPPPPLTNVCLVSYKGDKNKISLGVPRSRSLFGRFSPVGTKFLFISRKLDGSMDRIMVGELDGNKIKPLILEKQGSILAAVWSPDGRKIAYLHSAAEQKTKSDEESESVVSLKIFGCDIKEDPIVIITDKQKQWETDNPILDWR